MLQLFYKFAPMNQILHNKQQFFHKNIRKQKYNASVLKKRNLIQQKFFNVSKQLVLNSPQDLTSLIEDVEERIKLNKQCLQPLESLLRVLHFNSFSSETFTKQQAQSLIVRCTKLFINIFCGKDMDESALALLGIYNLFSDYQDCGFIETKLHFVNYFFEVVGQQRKKRKTFSLREMQEIQFIYSNFLVSHEGMLSKQQIDEILYTVSENTKNVQLIIALSKAVENFIRNPQNLIVYKNQLITFVSWLRVLLNNDNDVKCTASLLRTLNILLNSYLQQYGNDIVEKIVNVCLKHINSVSDNVKSSMYNIIIFIVKSRPQFYSLIIKEYFPKLQKHLLTQSMKIKIFILHLYIQIIVAQGEGQTIRVFRKGELYKIIVQYLKIENQDQLYKVVLQMLNTTIHFMKEEDNPVQFCKQLRILGVEESIKKLAHHQNEIISTLSEQLSNTLFSKVN